MNTEWYIAKRMIRGGGDDRYSRPIIRIAIIGIILGMAVMILSAGIVTGFRSEIRDKMIGFGSHIRIGKLFSADQGNSGIPISQPFYPQLDTLEGVRHIQRYAYKPGLVQTGQRIQGVIIKGIGPDHDNAFFRDKLQEGRIPRTSMDGSSDGILISRFIADRLELGIDDAFIVHLIQQGERELRPRKFQVEGIYKSGLEKFDKKFLIADITHIQNVEGWGLETGIRVLDSCPEEEGVLIEGLGFKGSPPYRYDWEPEGVGKGPGPHRLCLRGDSTVRLILRDDDGTIPDTAQVRFQRKAGKEGDCPCKEDLELERWSSGGSGKHYTGGFEVLLDDFSALEKMDRIIYERIPREFDTTTIEKENQEIFSWLEMLDVNVLIVIILMIGVAAINMTSALLVLILERARSIGILKAMGSSNASVGKVFLYHAAFLVGVGLIGGNLLGLGLGTLQQLTGWISLSEENYYVSEVPVLFKVWQILALNTGTFILCCLVLLIPSWFVSRIRPVRVIRFQ